ncbi:MAG: late competence development ComFB family protein [Candidatus Omnitrophica bacterium]|nr:late competence development ComFB family protein [Candidatus Omnitrophota bacterium]MBU1871502.1 late competence development ComFB family protein [Candidatus Omnitrophota bacterium]
MEIHNYMEDIVKEALNSMLEGTEIKNICKCQKCQYDIMAWALNRLPPKYFVSDKGRLYTKLQEVEVQFRADVIKELTNAITLISLKPQH